MPRRWRPDRRMLIIGAAVLAVIGLVLITIAITTSRSGAPEPTAANAGNIDGTSSPAITSTIASTAETSSTTGISAAAGSNPASVSSPSETAQPEPAQTESAPPEPAATPALLLPPAKPIAISIPSIGAASELLELGLASDGTIEVPPLNDPNSRAGWFDQSPDPGTLGPSIILGHVDTKTYGPGIFYNLGKLNPGDTIEVTRDDSTVAIFKVDGVRSYAKAEFPTLEVYGNLTHAGLRLITCGGVFNSEVGHYENNTVVFATLDSTRPA